MSALKRKNNHGAKDPLKKRKKLKPSLDTDEDVHKAEFLDIQTIREGMLILGCIFEIRFDCLLMSLPGCLVGTVPLTNISRKYTEELKSSEENEKSERVTLQSIFELGGLYPCKVLQITQESKRKPTITLSIDPHVVNSNLKLQSLYSKMVLYAAVLSIEDHGYVMDVGISGIQGFLPFKAAGCNKLLSLGQVLPTYLKNFSTEKASGNVVCLASLGFDDIFPEISNEDVKLSSILPGAKVSAYICEVKQPFFYLKCLNYEACSSMLSVNSSSKKFTDATKVTGTVLYVHPITHCIYLLLGALPTPRTFNDFFTLKKYQKIKNLKFHAVHHNKLFFKYQDQIGYVKAGDVAGKTSLSHNTLIKNPIVKRARVVFFHYMDNLIQLTFKESLLKMKIVRPDEVEIGDIYEVTVKKHMENGMFISICPGLSGFIRHVFFSDAFITMPEKLYPEGSKLNCRVLSIHPFFGLNLTCKESLMNLANSDLLKSYDAALIGKCLKGVVVKKTDEYMIILFFNNVQGIVASENIPKSAIYFLGQTVLCTVISCDPLKKKLKLSLNCEKHVLQNFHNSNFAEKNQSSGISSLNSSHVSDKNDLYLSEGTNIKDVIAHSFNLQPTHIIPKFQYVEGEPYKAFIKKITAHQLNIVVNGQEKGRIHITQLRCSKEDLYPLKKFSVGQRLKVYIIKEFKRQRGNYLKITHQNICYFLECSLSYPTAISLGKKAGINKPIIGFIKEIYDSCASIWISPYRTGTLNYVDVSENPKILRKLKRNFKVGQSISVSALPGTVSSKNKSEEVKFTKPGITIPDVGKNVVGFITNANPNEQLVLDLPHGYTGIAHLTDLQDVFTDLNPLLEKYLKLKFVLCHVLEVNHDKRSCVLSLRKSRLYKKIICNKSIIPEMTIEKLVQGKVVKGYIKSVINTDIIVNIGRRIEGKVSLHECSTYECLKCSKIADILKNCSIGHVIEVVIDSTIFTDSLVPLSLPDISNMDYSEDNRLSVKEDIDWEDL